MSTLRQRPVQVQALVPVQASVQAWGLAQEPVQVLASAQGWEPAAGYLG